MFKRLVPLTLTALCLLSGCANLSPLDIFGRVLAGAAVAGQGLFISDVDEVKIGLQTKAQVLSEMPEYPNPQVRDYVNAVGMKMVAQCERSTLPFEFHVVQSKDINAFAAPGGFVFITLPCLQLMTNEAELAGVLGHEVGHVAKKHSIGAIQKELVAQGVTTAVLGNDNNQLAKAGAAIASTLILKGFDRGSELEADKLGATYSYKAGYDPTQLGTFLNALRNTSGDLPGWLTAVSDHPRTDDRLQQLNDYIAQQKMQTAGKLVNEADYKSHITALIGTYTPPPSPNGSPAPSPSPSPSSQP